MTYFFDNDISPKIVEVLRILEVCAVHLRDEFNQDAADTEWIPNVAEKGWVIVTADEQMRRRKPEQEALTKANAIVVFLAHFSNKDRWEKVQFVIKHWPKIAAKCKRACPGSAFRVTMRGGIKVLAL